TVIYLIAKARAAVQHVPWQSDCLEICVVTNAQALSLALDLGAGVAVERDAIREAVLFAVVFDLAGEEDARRAWRELGGLELDDQLLHARLELRERHEPLDVERLQEVPDAWRAEPAAKSTAGEDAAHHVEK